MNTNVQSVLEVENLSVDYGSDRGEIHALRKVSFRLRAGEVVALVGESGCGKSTLALSLIRLLPIPPARFVEGRVQLGETEILSAGPREVQRARGTGVAMIFQEPLSSLNPVLKVGDQLGEAVAVAKSRSDGQESRWDISSFSSRPANPQGRYQSLLGLRSLRRGYPKEFEDEMLEVLSLVRVADARSMLTRYPFELSGGMRQRVMIAMALAQNPRLLIADEPTTALDVTTQAQVLRLMKELVDKQRTSLLLITHDLGVAAQVADRVLVMYAGEVVEDAEVNELFANPLHPYTKALLGCLPTGSKNDGPLGSIPGVVPDLRQRFEWCPFAERCPHVFGRCKVEQPSLQGDGKHGVACFLHSK